MASHLDDAKLESDECQIPTTEKSIIKPKRRADASSSEKDMGLGGKCSFANMAKSSFGNPKKRIGRY